MSYGTSYKAPVNSKQFNPDNFTQRPYVKTVTTQPVSDQENLTLRGTLSVAGSSQFNEVSTTGPVTLSSGSTALIDISSNPPTLTGPTLVNKHYVDTHVIKTDGTSHLEYGTASVTSLSAAGNVTCNQIQASGTTTENSMVTLAYANSNYQHPTGDIICVSLSAVNDVAGASIQSSSTIAGTSLTTSGTSTITGPVLSGFVRTAIPVTSNGVASKAYGDANWGPVAPIARNCKSVTTSTTCTTPSMTIAGTAAIASDFHASGALNINGGGSGSTFSGVTKVPVVTGVVNKTYCDTNFVRHLSGSSITCASAASSGSITAATGPVEIFNDTIIGGSLIPTTSLSGIGVYRSSLFAPTFTAVDGSWTMAFTPTSGGFSRIGKMIQISLSGTTTGPYVPYNGQFVVVNLPFAANSANWRFGGTVQLTRELPQYTQRTTVSVQRSSPDTSYLYLVGPPDIDNETQMRVWNFYENEHFPGIPLPNRVVAVSMNFFYYTT